MSKTNRRDFLTTTAGATAAATTAMAMPAKSYARISGSNDRLRFGLIGKGAIGTAHCKAFVELIEPNNLEPVAMADCWRKRADEATKLVGFANTYQDYRKVLDHKDIDYVTVATPEHWHSQMTMDAMDAGKAVYCEKPMTHTLPEAVKVMAKQRATGLPLQIGVQGTSDDSYLSARKAIDDGMLGTVVQAQIEYVRRYNQGPWRVPGLSPDMPKPDDLNWKDWLGHHPERPWNPNHYFEWRNYSDYSGGIATDLFIHRITRIMKACNLLYPKRVVGMGGIWQWNDGRDLPDNFEMICEYPRGMTVYVLGTMSNRVGIDHLIRGYRGTLYFTKTGWVAKDKDGKVLGEHKKTGAESIPLHHTNLHNHIRNGEELNCPVELGMAGVSAVCMANESWRSGRMMAWDETKQDMVASDQLKSSLPELPEV